MLNSDDLLLNLDPRPGASIDNVCREAQKAADRVGITVRFVFNGVVCFAEPGGDGAGLSKSYWVAGEGGIARARKKPLT